MSSNVESVSVIAAAKRLEEKLLPKKSKLKYEKTYSDFLEWRKTTDSTGVSENILNAYFDNLSEKIKPSSMWAYFSMLKSMIKLHDNVDIGTYYKLTAFLKSQSQGYEPVQAEVLTSVHINKFIVKAPDAEWLDVKVVCIFGMFGTLRTDELTRITINDVERQGNTFLVYIWETKTKTKKFFTIVGSPFVDIVAKYAALRISRMPSNRFFANYRNGKCTVQVIGKYKFSKMPLRVANYLELPNPERYTGHSLRRSSASCAANAGASAERIQRMGKWRSSKIAEHYVEESLHYKNETANIITKAISTSKSNAASSIVASQGYKNMIDDDSDIDLNDENTVNNGVASQGYKELAVDDCDFSSADLRKIEDTVGRSALKVINNGNVNLPSTSKMDCSKFNFNNCNVTINMK